MTVLTNGLACLLRHAEVYGVSVCNLRDPAQTHLNESTTCILVDCSHSHTCQSSAKIGCLCNMSHSLVLGEGHGHYALRGVKVWVSTMRSLAVAPFVSTPAGSFLATLTGNLVTDRFGGEVTNNRVRGW